jgi:hypothetical protein
MHSHFNFFPENMAAVSNEHGENIIWTFPEWKKRTGENGVQILWLTTAGVL